MGWEVCEIVKNFVLIAIALEISSFLFHFQILHLILESVILDWVFPILCKFKTTELEKSACYRVIFQFYSERFSQKLMTVDEEKQKIMKYMMEEGSLL